MAEKEKEHPGKETYEKYIQDRIRYGQMVDTFEHDAELSKKTADEKVLRNKDTKLIEWDRLNAQKMGTNKYQLEYVDEWAKDATARMQASLKADLSKVDSAYMNIMLEAFTGHNKSTMLELVETYKEGLKTELYRQAHLSRHIQQFNAKLKKEAAMQLKAEGKIINSLDHLKLGSKFNREVLAHPTAGETYAGTIGDLLYHHHETGSVSDKYIKENPDLSPLYVPPKKTK
ncbi:MAG: hypothetical protein ACP5N3_03745 [Candidatus Nanoarchaeia archaeon]